MICGLRATKAWLYGVALAVGSMPVASQAVECDLVICGRQGAVRVQLSVMHRDRPLAEKWTENFAAMVKFFDRNGDQQLSETEAVRLPSLQAMREVLGAGFTPDIGQSLNFADLDANKDGQASESEVAVYYRRAGIGKPLVGAGLLPQTTAMNAALLQLLDANKDGHADEAELKGAAAAIQRFDRNDDEMIGAGEFLVGLRYPGASGSYLLLPPKPDSDTKTLPGQIAAVPLPEEAQDVAWAAHVIRRLDHDDNQELTATETGFDAKLFASLDANQNHRLVEAELAKWREQAPNFGVQIQLAAPTASVDSTEPVRAVPVAKSLSPDNLAPQAGSLVLAKPGINVVVRTDLGNLGETSAARYGMLRQQLDDDDLNDDGLLDKSELENSKDREWTSLLPAIDRNGDDQLAKEELESWLKLQQQLADSQVLFTLLDAGQGLFELLDTNHDGALSVAELQASNGHVARAGAVKEGRLAFDQLPQMVLLTVSHGYPQSVLGTVERSGPNWFLAMDRNRDGEISKREFAGPAIAFKKLDADRDERISLSEAQSASK